MGAPEGNQNGIKIKDPEIRQIAYESYCAHLAAGNGKKSWYFEHPTESLTWQTMDKYILDEVEFNSLKKRIAECKGYGHWERVVQDSAKGTNKDANTATLQMLMRNKYGWDRVDHRHNDESSATEQEYQKLMEQLNRYQQAVQSSAPI